MDKYRENVLKKSMKTLKRAYNVKFFEQHSRKYWIGKRQAMMAYMDSGFKNSRPSMTDWFFNWIDVKKKQIYPTGWLTEILSKRNH